MVKKVLMKNNQDKHRITSQNGKHGMNSNGNRNKCAKNVKLRHTHACNKLIFFFFTLDPTQTSTSAQSVARNLNQETEE